MNKRILTILSVLLILSLGFNIYQAILLNQIKQEDQEQFEMLCRDVAQACIAIPYYLDNAITDNNRELVVTMGGSLTSLATKLHTPAASSYGIIENNTIAYLSTILIQGDSYKNIAPIGRMDDDSPFTEWEIQFLQAISQALEVCAQAFYDDPNITIYNYHTAELKHKGLENLNQALADFEKAVAPLLDNRN